MSVKLLISGESNSGKTTLTKNLKDSLIISHDGKKYPFKVPHVLVESFTTADELVALISDKILAYKEKFGVYPKTIVFDSISKIFDTILDYCNTKHTGFKIYSELNRDIHVITDYIQNTLIGSEMNVVIISHAIWNQDTAKYDLVGKGDYAKRGGVLAETDYALFIETRNNKRVLHFRSTKFPARTLHEADPDTLPVEDFNLQTYLDTLGAVQNEADEFII